MGTWVRGWAGGTHRSAATAPLVSYSASMTPADWSSSNLLISLQTSGMGVCKSGRVQGESMDSRHGVGGRPLARVQ